MKRERWSHHFKNKEIIQIIMNGLMGTLWKNLEYWRIWLQKAQAFIPAGDASGPQTLCIGAISCTERDWVATNSQSLTLESQPNWLRISGKHPQSLWVFSGSCKNFFKKKKKQFLDAWWSKFDLWLVLLDISRKIYYENFRR